MKISKIFFCLGLLLTACQSNSSKDGLSKDSLSIIRAFNAKDRSANMFIWQGLWKNTPVFIAFNYDTRQFRLYTDIDKPVSPKEYGKFFFYKVHEQQFLLLKFMNGEQENFLVDTFTKKKLLIKINYPSSIVEDSLTFENTQELYPNSDDLVTVGLGIYQKDYNKEENLSPMQKIALNNNWAQQPQENQDGKDEFFRLEFLAENLVYRSYDASSRLTHIGHYFVLERGSQTFLILEMEKDNFILVHYSLTKEKQFMLDFPGRDLPALYNLR